MKMKIQKPWYQGPPKRNKTRLTSVGASETQTLLIAEHKYPSRKSLEVMKIDLI